jgi:glyoxylase-like metal-dependent hydrolase (beta-lactamase superfamily II)
MEIKRLALGMVNAYLLKNKNDYFLIDTGLAMNRSKLEKALEQEGVKPGDIKLVIITHGDIDHIGNCAYLQKKYGLKIAVHEAEAKQCRTGKLNSSRKRKASGLAKIISYIRYAFVVKPMMKKFPPETFEPDMIISDGQDFHKIGFDAKAVFIPGHTMGSIGILTADGDFFSGDTLINREQPMTAYIIENETLLSASLEKIKSLSIRNVYPGHGKPFPMSELKF